MSAVREAMSPATNATPKLNLMLGRQCARSQQNRCGGQGDAELLHQNPGEEQQIAVREENVRR